jgi:predicted HAD superfamily Cof-like phosphohydrolase
MNDYVDLATSPHNSYQRVREFHKAFGHPVAETPTLAYANRARLRIDLIREELEELEDAVRAKDIIAIADALGDLEYVVNGAALEYGINLPAVVKEIHRSNMTKLGPGAKPIYREDGKILKGEGYESPNLKPILGM